MEKLADDKSKRLIEGLRSALKSGGEDGRRGKSIILCLTWSQLKSPTFDSNLRDDNWNLDRKKVEVSSLKSVM